MDLGVSVHLTGGREHITRVVRVGKRERLERPDAIDLERLDWMVQIVARAGRRREVQDQIKVILDGERRRDVLLYESESTISAKMFQIPCHPGEQIVDPDDTPLLRDEAVAEVRAEEPGRPGDEHLRRRSKLRPHLGPRCPFELGVTSPPPRL